MPWLAPKRWTAATRRAGLTDERRARWRAAPRRLDRGAPREAAHKRRRTLARWPAPRAGWTEERRGATKERRGATREASAQSGAGHRSVSTKDAVSETALPADPVDAEDLRARVDRELVALLDRELAALEFMDGDLDLVAGMLRRFVLEGGKRLRPAFVWWGYRGAGGRPEGPRAEAVVRAACSVELLHVCALI